MTETRIDRERSEKGILTRIFGGGRLAVPLALAAVSSAAQTPLERELLSSGFENVRQLKGETGSYVFSNRVPFRSMRDAVDAVTVGSGRPETRQEGR